MSANEPGADPRTLRTRFVIEHAFLELLGEKSLSQLTVGDITQRAGVHRGTFYSHFLDKYNLFDHIVRKTFLETLGRHVSEDARLDASSLRALIQATCDYFAYLNTQCPPSERQFRPLAEGQVQAVLCEVFTSWLGGNPGAADRAAFVSWAIFGACRQRTGDRRSADLDALTSEVYALAAMVLLSAEGA